MNAGTKRLAAKGAVAIAGVEMDSTENRIFLDHIVITVECIESLICIKARDGAKAVGMRFFYLGKRAVFPQFVAIAELNINEFLPIIIVQRCEVQIFIFEKVVIGVSDAAVAVGKEGIAGLVVERQVERVIVGSKGVGEAPGG